MKKSEIILEFNKIKEMLCEYAVSENAKQILQKLSPFLNEFECKNKINETTDARNILDKIGNPPISTMKEIDKIILLCEKEYMLFPEQLEHISIFIASCNRMKNYLKKSEHEKSEICYYGQSIFDLLELKNQIDESIQNSSVQSSASTELKNIRRKIENIHGQIQNKLNDLLRNKKNFFSDSYISQRNDRFVLPVKKEYKNQIGGTVIDISKTGGTYFIEPAIVSKFREELTILKMQEENEINKILYILTGFVHDCMDEIKINMDAMTTLDIIFAKAKLSADMKAIPAEINLNHIIEIEQGKHPLIDKDDCIPLDFSIGKNINGIVITGPNTGGKTVALKTIGLLAMMAQSGLHVPAKRCKICMNNLILCDIGDGQSITENLSTFSSHIKNIIEILSLATDESLVLLDELGSGTDPMEGMGIAISILEELRNKNCLFIATTHYPEVKEYARKAVGLTNARMAFDRENLKPLYKLEIGEAGESCALYIAQKIGLPKHMLALAYEQAYHANTKQETTLVQEFNFEDDEKNILNTNCSVPKIQKSKELKIKKKVFSDFCVGDSVLVYPEKNIGIVFKTEDEKGNIGVQIKGEKFFINYKRVKLNIAAKELYPENYDFSIIFDTVENRKASHEMNRKYSPNIVMNVQNLS